MKTFSIAEAEQYSLIKAHTFRTWEKRYGIFKGGRSANNIRFYELTDLASILNFSLLNRFGCKVSDLATLSEETIREKVSELKSDTAKQENQINQLILTMFSYDIEEFEGILDSSVAIWGIHQTIDNIIIPFLERLKLYCYNRHTSGEYHFVVTALRKKLILSIEQTGIALSSQKSVLFCLPEGEHFDLLLLYLTYQLKQKGFRIFYLGTNISAKNMHTIIAKKSPDFTLLYVSPKALKAIKNDFVSRYSSEETITYFVTVHSSNSPENELPEKMKLIGYKDVVTQLLGYRQENLTAQSQVSVAVS